MVKHPKATKTSSETEAVDGFVFQSTIRCVWNLPTDLKLLTTTNLYGQTGSYTVTGKATDIVANPAKWRVLPHLGFVNLPAEMGSKDNDTSIVDPGAMMKFVGNFGFIRARPKGSSISQTFTRLQRPSSEVKSSIDRKSWGQLLICHVSGHSQSLLQYAWESGDSGAVKLLQIDASTGLAVNASGNGLQLECRNLWSLICLLFLRDFASGRAARCANPDCPVPYFVRKRRTQKICESGDCVTWAQRRYALKWWHENHGKKPSIARKGGHK
jgi:hypothetical protein